MKRSLAVLSLLPVLALSACGSGTDKAAAAPSGKAAASCGTLPAADPAAVLPSGFPVLADQVLYEPKTLGTTKILFGLLAQDSFLAVRDELVTKMKAAGYTVPGTDQESVEAEAEFAGPHRGTVKVEVLCKGHVSVRYKFNG